MSRAPVWVVRPEPGAAATLAAADARGLAAEAAPLFVVEPTPWTRPAPERFDAVLIASANAVRHGGPALARFAALPAYAVGEVTAAAARAAGFTVVATGRGGAQELVKRLASDGRARVFRPAGAAHVALDLPPDLLIETVVVYAARALPLADRVSIALRGGAVVMLHSAEAARHLAAECDRLGIARERIRLACLAPRIAAAAGAGWGAATAAERADEAALLALAERMCQTA